PCCVAPYAPIPPFSLSPFRGRGLAFEHRGCDDTAPFTRDPPMSKIPPVGRLVVPLFFFALLGLAAYAPSPAPAARPPAPADTGRWENLLVLPDTLSRDEIRDIMRGFGRALGVRCSHCHVREGEDFDFASDAKPEKE